MPEGPIRERELKLAVPGDFELPVPSAGALVRPDGQVVLTAVYWDTADRRLTAAGHSLRHRHASDGSEHGWTVKLAATADRRDTGAADRTEAPFRGPQQRPPTAAVAVLKGLIGRAELVEVATLVTHRATFEVLDDRGAPTLRVMDDRVHVSLPGGASGELREVELELVDADGTFPKAYVKALRKAGAAKPDPTPKIVRALAMGPASLGQDSSGHASPGQADADHGAVEAEGVTEQPDDAPASRTDASRTGGRPRTVRDLVVHAFASALDQLLLHDPHIRLGHDEDDEHVHQARVATRRLRSHLRALEGTLDADWSRRVGEELRWLGGSLGTVRDLDVLAVHLRTHVDGRPDLETKAVTALFEALDREVADARALLARDMASRRYVDLVEDLRAAVAKPPLAAETDPEAEADATVRDIARRAWKRLERGVRGLDHEPADAELHRIRRRAKQARYAAELASTVVGKDAARHADAISRLQDVLGDLQDAVTADEWLRRVMIERQSLELAFLAGDLCERQRVVMADARRSWQKRWKQARAARVTGWL